MIVNPEETAICQQCERRGRANPFIQALGTGEAASDDQMMPELKCSAAEFYAVFGELIDDGVVVEDGAGIRLAESSVAVA